MTARASRKTRLPQDDDPQPDLASLMMVRAMAEMFRNEPEYPVPEPFAAILQRMESWERDMVNMQPERDP
jgi:hypothetical protein